MRLWRNNLTTWFEIDKMELLSQISSHTTNKTLSVAQLLRHVFTVSYYESFLLFLLYMLVIIPCYV